MSEIDWMYDSLTERFGEALGERQKVVDALLIAKAVVGPGTLGSSNHEGIISVARFILDEWGKCSDAEDPGKDASGEEDPEVEPEVLFYSDLYRIRTRAIEVSPDDVWVTSTGKRVSIRRGKFFLLGTDVYGDRVESPPFVPSEKVFPITKEN